MMKKIIVFTIILSLCTGCSNETYAYFGTDSSMNKNISYFSNSESYYLSDFDNKTVSASDIDMLPSFNVEGPKNSGITLKNVDSSDYTDKDTDKPATSNNDDSKLEASQTRVVKYSNKEKQELQTLVFCEAGNQGEKGMLLVANVVINRMKSSKSSMHSVIFASGQFNPTWDGSFARNYPKAIKKELPKNVYSAVDKALAGTDYSQGAMYFCTPASYKVTAWFHSLKHLFTYGGHMFFKQ